MRVSIEGNIGSGKSTVIASLASSAHAHAFETFVEPVDEWGDLLDLFYSSPAEWALAFSLKVLMSFRAPAAHEGNCLVERSPLACRHVFSQLLYNDGSLTQQEWDLFKEYHDVLAWKPDCIVYVDTPVEVCMARVQHRDRVSERGLDVEYLKRVEFQYLNVLRFVDVPVVRLDGTLPRDQLHAAALEAINNIFSTPRNELV